MVSVTPIEMRVSAARARSTENVHWLSARLRSPIMARFLVPPIPSPRYSITRHSIPAQSIPPLLVKTLSIEFLDEACIVERLRLRFFRCRVSCGGLIQNFLNTLPGVVWNLVDIIDRVLVNRIESLGVRGSGVFADRAPAEFLIGKQHVHTFTVRF